MPSKTSPAALVAARQEFLDAWARLGPAWGVSRTMSQIHALLMVADAPMNTDDVMAALAISRGNAHKNIKELCAWGLLKEMRVAGESKGYFVAEKDDCVSGNTVPSTFFPPRSSSAVSASGKNVPGTVFPLSSRP